MPGKKICRSADPRCDGCGVDRRAEWREHIDEGLLEIEESNGFPESDKFTECSEERDRREHACIMETVPSLTSFVCNP